MSAQRIASRIVGLLEKFPEITAKNHRGFLNELKGVVEANSLDLRSLRADDKYSAEDVAFVTKAAEKLQDFYVTASKVVELAEMLDSQVGNRGEGMKGEIATRISGELFILTTEPQ